MSDKPITDRIIKASAVIALAHLILKMAGLIQAKAGAHYMSTSEYEAILVVAFDGVILALFFIGEEVIGPSFLPVFLKEKDDKGEDAAWLFTSIFVSIQFIILIVVVSILMLFPDFIISVLTKWSPEENPNRYPLLKESIVWLAPSLICLSLGSTTYMLLNGYKKFFLAAIGDAAWKFCVVIALVVGIGIFNYDYKAILFGLLIGSLAKLITHLFGLLSHLTRFRVSFNWNNPAMKTVLLLILPLLAGILFAKFRDIFNNVYVLSGISSSVKGGSEGLMQANNLGKKLFDGINAIVPYAIHIALLPFFCELVDQKDTRKLGELISKCIRLLLPVFFPAAIIIAVLAQPIAIVLFEGGKLEIGIAIWIGLSTATYIMVLPAQSIESVLVQGFFASRKMVSVMVIGMIFSAVSVIISYVFIIKMNYNGYEALLVVAGGFVLSRYLKTIALILYLRRSLPILKEKGQLIFLAKVFCVTILTGAAAYTVMELFHFWAEIDAIKSALARQKAAHYAMGLLTFWSEADLIKSSVAQISDIPDYSKKAFVLKGIVAGTAAATTFFISAFLIKLQEPFEILKWTVAKFRPGKETE